MEQANELLKYQLLGISFHQYALAFIAILAGYAGKLFLTIAVARLLAAAQRTRTRIDDIILNAVLRPGGWACVIGGVYAATLVMPIPTDPVDIRQFVDALMRGVSSVLVVWLAIILFEGLIDYWAEAAEKTDTKLDDQMVPVIRSSGKTFLIIIGLVLFLQNIGYSVTSLLAGLGLGGMALALASKDSLANVFGSIVLFIDRPFQVGDWIEMGSLEGTVEEIGLRTTRIRTFANSLITIPNAQFTTTAINNWSRMKKRRIKMTIGITYDTPPDKVERAVDKIREIIEDDEKIHSDFYLVNFDTFGDFSLNIFIYCFTVTTNWGGFLDAKQEFMLKVMRAFEEMGIEFAFPTRTLHVASMPGEPEAMKKQRPE